MAARARAEVPPPRARRARRAAVSGVPCAVAVLTAVPGRADAAVVVREAVAARALGAGP